MVFKVTCLALLVVGVAQSAVLPEDKCKLGDDACLTPAFQKMIPIFMAGIPEANVEVMDPLQMGDLDFELAGLKFSMKGGVLKGLKSTVINGVEWDTKKKVFSVDFHLDTSVRGQYKAGGTILLLPITGDGQMKLKLKKLQVKLYIHYDIVKGADGKDYIKLMKYTFDFDVKDGAHYHLTNLFDGNKELSDTMLAFLNENWKQVVVEFGRPMVEAAAEKIYKNIGNYLESMPVEAITAA